jgi:undecaprenyl-diphosphatase
LRSCQINSFARDTPWLHGPLFGYSSAGVLVMAVLLLILWWTVRRWPQNTAQMAAVLWTPVATLLALGINQFLVAAVHEARPYTALPGIFVLATRNTDPSFPATTPSWPAP